MIHLEGRNLKTLCACHDTIWEASRRLDDVDCPACLKIVEDARYEAKVTVGIPGFKTPDGRMVAPTRLLDIQGRDELVREVASATGVSLLAAGALVEAGSWRRECGRLEAQIKYLEWQVGQLNGVVEERNREARKVIALTRELTEWKELAVRRDEENQALTLVVEGLRAGLRSAQPPASRKRRA